MNSHSDMVDLEMAFEDLFFAYFSWKGNIHYTESKLIDKRLCTNILTINLVPLLANKFKLLYLKPNI